MCMGVCYATLVTFFSFWELDIALFWDKGKVKECVQVFTIQEKKESKKSRN